MSKKIKILHLEDSLYDSELICTLINIGKIEFEYFLADNENDYLKILETEKIDIILSDYQLPDYDGNQALRVAREKYSHMPFIFVSGAMGEDRAINAMLNGATDYVLKNKLERLVPAINRAMNEYELSLLNKQSELALHESEKKYKDLINEVNDGYFITNIHGEITFSNISMAKILGFNSPEELLGHFFTEFNKIGNVKGVNYTFKKIIKNKKRFDGLELEVLRQDGKSIHIEIKAVPVLEFGKITGMQGVVHNITERKRAEIDLKEKSDQIEAQNDKYIIINKELEFQNEEKIKRAAELVIANKELVYQNEEKEKRADELIIANILKDAEEKYKLLLEEKNRVITDSIIYAKKIQEAILPNKEDIYSTLSNSFILYKPKDIVSGDFYFFEKKEKLVFIVVADCTGHGVPGALMSMIGAGKLTNAFKQTTDISEILKYLNKEIKKSFHQTDIREVIRDGMDIAICSIDIENRIVKFAGAKTPLWLIRNGQAELEEIKGTNVVIGGATDDNQYFETHKIKMQMGDTIYLSTDGYADQFNGYHGKKIMRKRFKEILVEIQNLSMQEQETYLNNFVEDWKNGTKQIDDILVAGIRL